MDYSFWAEVLERKPCFGVTTPYVITIKTR